MHCSKTKLMSYKFTEFNVDIPSLLNIDVLKDGLQGPLLITINITAAAAGANNRNCIIIG